MQRREINFEIHHRSYPGAARRGAETLSAHSKRRGGDTGGGRGRGDEGGRGRKGRTEAAGTREVTK